MNRHFFLWYYTYGLRATFSLAWDFLRFVDHRFSLRQLLWTLFAPWKRDVTFRTWRGFHPLRSLGALADNLFSRFWGAIVRAMVLVFGGFLWCGVVLISGAMIVLYVGAPVLIIVGVAIFPVAPMSGLGSLLAGTIGFGLALLGYAFREQDVSVTTDIAELRKERFFPRIVARLGLKKIPDDGFLRDTETFLRFLKTVGIDRRVFERAVAMERTYAERQSRRQRFWCWENMRKTRPVAKGWRYAYTPHLDRYCLDLSRRDPTGYHDAELIGRRDELEVATVVLRRPIQNNVIIVGDPGIGRKTFLHHLARYIRENAFSEERLNEMRFLLFDMGDALSEATSRGENVEHFLRTLLAEAAYAGNVVLAIENIDTYFSGDHNRPNLASLFNEFLQLPTFRVIATAPTGQYHLLAKEDEQVLKLFDVIYLREPNEIETFDILVRHFESVERKRVVFTVKGLEAVIASAGRYNWETPFPERAIDLAQEVFLYWQGTRESFIVPDVVDRFVSKKTGAPTGAFGPEEKEKLLHLEESLHERVIGQDEAVKQVAEAMRKARAGFGDAARPLGSFIFFGPSGVGKTETVKAFAESYFGDEKKMIRFDMSEFQTPESVDRMIGSRISGVQGELVAAAREKPFSILLLDEIEKAYPKALDLFLQILDEGYVTDGFGEKVSFRNMIIIATSNAGAPLIKSLVRGHASMAEIRKQVLDHIVENGLFRLEFLSRFDGLIFFEPLKREELETVASLKLRNFAERLRKEKNITITFSADVVPKIVEKGFEPEFGTRSLNRFIENAIEDVVVKKIISGEVVEGGSLTLSGNEL